MEEQPRRRRRPALSCFACRRRKIKCDRANPCARCVSTNTRCTYRVCSNEGAAVLALSQGGGEGLAALSPAASPLVQTQAIDGSTPLTGHSHHSSAPGMGVTTPAAPEAGYSNRTGDSGTPGPTSPRETVSDFRDLRQRVRKLEALSASGLVHGLEETGRHILTRQAGLRDSETTLKKTRLLRWSDWMGTAPEVRRILVSRTGLFNHAL